VLDRDLFKIEPSEIGKTEVLLTMVGGKVVYESPNWTHSTSADKKIMICSSTTSRAVPYC